MYVLNSGMENEIMKYMIAVLSILMTGCVYQTVSAGDILSATDICKTHGGINHIVARFDGYETTVCQDEYKDSLHNKVK